MKKIIYIAVFALSVMPAIGQPDNPDAPVPFGGLELLIAAGAAYGGKKLYDKKRQKA